MKSLKATLVDRLSSTIASHRMFEPSSRIVVAVSGGPDSVCLLWLLQSVSPGKLHIAHLNHSLRGVESDQDEEFVGEMAASLGIPITVERLAPNLLFSHSSRSPEAIARNIRYQFLERVANSIGALHIATGHTQDDQAETLLQRILIGSGLRGLRGILPKRPVFRNSPIFLNRPLIRISRQEINEFLSSEGIPFRTDSTNLQKRFNRNRIRNHLIPVLESHYNPFVKDALARLASIAKDSYDFLKKTAEEKLSRCCVVPSEKSVPYQLSIPTLQSESPAIQTMIIESIIERLVDQIPRLTYDHFERIICLMQHGTSGDVVTLPGNITIRKEHDRLSFVKGDIRVEKSSPPPRAISVPGETILPEFGIACRTRIIEGGMEILGQFPVEELDFTAIFDYDKLRLPLIVRFAQQGDSFQPIGMSGRKKLHDFFIDEKVPASMRQRIPLVVMDDELIWVVGYRISDTVKVSFFTKRILLLQIERLPGNTTS